MSLGFATCDACSRHVRAQDSVCPFCHAPVTSAARDILDRPGPRRSRAAIIAGAALAVGCSSSDPVPLPLYGGPPVVMEDGGFDAGMAQPVYGAPVEDGGLVAVDGGTRDDASVDAGGLDRDGGLTQPVYGTPAPL